MKVRGSPRATQQPQHRHQLTGPVVPCSQDLYVAEALSTLESWRSRYNQVVKDKGDLELEIIVLNEYVCVRRGARALGGRRVRRGKEPGGLRQVTPHTAATWSPGQGLPCAVMRAALRWVFWVDPKPWLQPQALGPPSPAVLWRGAGLL